MISGAQQLDRMEASVARARRLGAWNRRVMAETSEATQRYVRPRPTVLRVLASVLEHVDSDTGSVPVIDLYEMVRANGGKL